MTDFIRSRDGKLMAPRAYIDLVRAKNARSELGAASCWRQHDRCAGWERGPCSAFLEKLYPPPPAIDQAITDFWTDRRMEPPPGPDEEVE